VEDANKSVSLEHASPEGARVAADGSGGV
jgi:hypothetical protein